MNMYAGEAFQRDTDYGMGIELPRQGGAEGVHFVDTAEPRIRDLTVDDLAATIYHNAVEEQSYAAIVRPDVPAGFKEELTAAILDYGRGCTTADHADMVRGLGVVIREDFAFVTYSPPDGLREGAARTQRFYRDYLLEA